jgi:hypothetical protein
MGVGLGVGVGVSVGVGLVLRLWVEISFRCIAHTDTHFTWSPCHLVTMSLGNHVTW